MGRPARARASVKARGGSAQPRLSANVGPATCTDTGDPVPAGVTGGGHQPGKDKEVDRDPNVYQKKNCFSAVEALYAQGLLAAAMADTRLSMSEMEDRAEQISVLHLSDKSLSLSLSRSCIWMYEASSPCHSTSNNTAI